MVLSILSGSNEADARSFLSLVRGRIDPRRIVNTMQLALPAGATINPEGSSCSRENSLS